eukprot:7690999-Lingulodinium_polyedra.AAC.1
MLAQSCSFCCTPTTWMAFSMPLALADGSGRLPLPCTCARPAARRPGRRAPGSARSSRSAWP